MGRHGWTRFALGCGAVSIACHKAADVAGPIDAATELLRNLTVAEQSLIRSANAFSFDLLERVRAGEDGPNVVISPLSASLALGMTMNGAAGETWREMHDALRFEDMSEEELNEAYRTLLEMLIALDDSVTVRIGNSIWAKNGVAFEEAFYERVRQSFEAEVAELDFHDSGAVSVINDWVSHATNGRIEKVLDRIDPGQIMFLINALYFKGSWTHEIDPQLTTSELFKRTDGSTVPVQMMDVPTDSVPWVSTERYQAVELPYGRGAYALVAVLPAPDRTLEELVGSLDAQEWGALIAGLDETDMGTVRLPRSGSTMRNGSTSRSRTSE